MKIKIKIIQILAALLLIYTSGLFLGWHLLIGLLFLGISNSMMKLAFKGELK